MKATELRIGNWVEVGEKQIKVEAVDGSGINCEASGGYYAGDISTNYDGYFVDWGIFHRQEVIKPIPLSEDWLKRFGFRWSGDHYSHTSGYRIDSNQGEYFFCLPILTASKFRYVHQLQNLYFALTGQELTLK